LDQDQAAKIAAELAELRSAEALPAEEAQSRLDAIGSLLTPEQKAVFDSFGVRFERPSDGGSKPDENPFSQGANRQRLEDLLGRLKPAGS
jgi:Spy/CpxP family protein refolding chaperone